MGKETKTNPCGDPLPTAFLSKSYVNCVTLSQYNNFGYVGPGLKAT